MEQSLQRHSVFMRRCFDLARFSNAKVMTNPNVGAVVVKDGKVQSEGLHEYFGGPHAEVNALEPLQKEDLNESEIFISLEPCSYHGKTPPCAELLVRRNIKACFISQIDPNQKVSGRGIEILRKAGIQVMENINSDEGSQLLKPFFVQHRFKRPYVILKWAQSRDGYLGSSGKRTKISTLLSDRLVHKWRSEVGAIMVGSKTVLIDDPLLSNRLYWGSNPTRIVLDRSKRIPLTAKILRDGEIPTLYYTAEEVSPVMPTFITICLPEGTGLDFILTDLYKRNIGTILVEGGSKLLSQFIRERLWDEVRIIESPVILKQGVKGPSIPQGRFRYWQLGKDRIYRILRD